MTTRRTPDVGLTPETAALSLTARQRAELTSPSQDEFPDEEQTPADRVQTMLESFADAERATVKVYRKLAPGKPLSWCKDFAPDEFEGFGFEGIREIWGPGDYEIRLYAVDPESRKYVVRAKQNITIERSVQAFPVAVPTNSMNSELGAVLQTLAQGQQRMLEALTARPSVDPMAQFTQTMTLMGTMREFFQPQAQQKSSIAEIMEAVREMRAVAAEINPAPEKSDDGLMGMASEFLGVMKNLSPQQQAQTPAITHQPNPIPENSETEQMKIALIFELRGKLDKLVKMAEEKKSVEEGAKFLDENLPDEFVEALYSDEWFDALSTVHGAVKPHQVWFTEVRKVAEKYFFGEGEDDATPSTVTGS